MDIRHLTNRIDPLSTSSDKEKVKKPSQQNGDDFARILEKISNQGKSIQFSGHAIKRLEDRSIQLNEKDVNRLQNAVNLADQKGSKESLILDGDRAYVVNIPNRTVITALDMMEMRNRVFTNIDSTVFTENK
jgi:flagellar operon protein